VDIRIRALEEQIQSHYRALERYFPSDIARSILSNESGCELNGGHMDITALFFDLRSSTKIAESLEPLLFSEFLSQLFTDIMDLIYGNGGSVNKMLGDGLLATFGPPSPSPNDAKMAIVSAVQIIEHLDTFNDVRPEYLKEPIKAGIGIASGRVFAGFVGSVRRMEYTVLGDAVNIAARLEAATKELNTPIAIDEESVRLAGDGFDTVFLERLTLRGRKEPIGVYGISSMVENG